MSGRNESEGNRIVAYIKDRGGIDTLFLAGDIWCEATCKRMIDDTVTHFGKVDGLVNNAGIFPRSGMVDATEALFDSVLSNCTKVWDAAMREVLAMAHPLICSGRMQMAEDMAYGIYLLSDEASQVTGSELAISGGFIK
jgi:NAD(P)-dependent dehydrogenase (short-subunit alcohol dehydrogenase family)